MISITPLVELPLVMGKIFSLLEENLTSFIFFCDTEDRLYLEIVSRMKCGVKIRISLLQIRSMSILLASEGNYRPRCDALFEVCTELATGCTQKPESNILQLLG